jgi:hypothetical protein
VLHEIQLTTEIIPWVTYVNHVAIDILNQLQLTVEIIAITGYMALQLTYYIIATPSMCVRWQI